MFSAYPTLKLYSSYYKIGDRPTGKRFDDGLLLEWIPRMRNLARGFAIQGKLEEDDIVQELTMVMWRLTRRVDPVNQPKDFSKLLWVEMRNRCVDLLRYLKAHKRSAKKVNKIYCKACETYSVWAQGMSLICPNCGANVKEVAGPKTKYMVEQILSDESFYDVKSSDGQFTNPLNVVAESAGSSAFEELNYEELIYSIYNALPEDLDKKIFMIYVNPSPHFIDFAGANGKSVNPNKITYKMLSTYFGGISSKTIKESKLRIFSVVADLSGRDDLFFQTEISA